MVKEKIFVLNNEQKNEYTTLLKKMAEDVQHINSHHRYAADADPHNVLILQNTYDHIIKRLDKLEVHILGSDYDNGCLEVNPNNYVPKLEQYGSILDKLLSRVENENELYVTAQEIDGTSLFKSIRYIISQVCDIVS